MCIAILNTPKGGLIPESVLKTCWDSNRDGAGFTFPLDGKMEVYKELKKFSRFYKAYEIARTGYPKANFIIHFRIKTHGLITKENCHPFLINDGLAFAHNGMVDGFQDPKKSDTVLFMEKVLRKMPDGFLKHEGCRRLIRRGTGWSKFIFVGADNEYTIINEEGGKWDGGNWYSNETYKRREYKDVGGTRVYQNGYGSGYTHYPTTTQVAGYELPFKADKKKDEDEDWIEKRYAAANHLGEDDITDALPVAATPEGRYCSECYTLLSGKMENHYGCCTKCLVDYEVIPPQKLITKS